MSVCPNRLSDRAVYLGDGVWWQLTERQKRDRAFPGLPERIRPICNPALDKAIAKARADITAAFAHRRKVKVRLRATTNGETSHG